MGRPRFELEKFFQADAAEIAAAREKAVLIHHTQDIDTAGDEVERTVRTVLRRRLPRSYYIGHGHIVDSDLNTSADMDIVIADNTYAPVLFTAQDGTEYFPYEALYAVAEVKSTYYQHKRYIEKFIQDLDGIRNRLNRRSTPLSYIGNGIHLGENITLTEHGNGERTYRNPLFSFMLFVDSGTFAPDHLRELFSSTPDFELPNVLCFLDRGIVVNVRASVDRAAGTGEAQSIQIHPEFNSSIPDSSYHWVFVPFGNEENRIGLNYCFLYFALLLHLGSCHLMPPNMQAYMTRFFDYSSATVITQ